MTEKMVSIHVHTPFNLTLADNSVMEFKKGKHSVTPDIAQHWFVTAHAEAAEAWTAGNDEDLLAQIAALQQQVDDLGSLACSLLPAADSVEEKAELGEEKEGADNGKKSKSASGK